MHSPYQLLPKYAYLAKLGSHYVGRFNTYGWGFPDVAAACTNLETVWKGTVTGV